MKLQTNYAIMLFITLLFILIVNGQNVAAQNIQTVKKELPAVKTEQPPTIDGVLNDACWQDTPQANRLIWQKDGSNIYFALRRSGYAGTDFFIILGDPNASKFRQRLVAKVIRAF